MTTTATTDASETQHFYESHTGLHVNKRSTREDMERQDEQEEDLRTEAHEMDSQETLKTKVATAAESKAQTLGTQLHAPNEDPSIHVTSDTTHHQYPDPPERACCAANAGDPARFPAEYVLLALAASNAA